MAIETWKDVVGYNGEYEISDQGRVKSFKNKRNPKILKTFLNHRGYVRVNLLKEGKMKQVFVHRLVVQAFIGEINPGFYVNHIDGNKGKNTLGNLEIVTQSENALHSFYVLGNGTRPVLMLDPKDYSIIKEYPSISKASAELNTDDAAICKVCTEERNFACGYSWMYKEDYTPDKISAKKERAKKKLKSRKSINKIDSKTLEVIETFPSAREAGRVTGVKSIIHCATGRIKTAGGYIWRYV